MVEHSRQLLDASRPFLIEKKSSWRRLELQFVRLSQEPGFSKMNEDEKMGGEKRGLRCRLKGGRKVDLAGRSSGRDRKPTIDYQACYYEQRRSFFRNQKLVFNAGFVAFFWPEGAPVGNNYIIEPYDHALHHYTWSSSQFAVSALWELALG